MVANITENAARRAPVGAAIDLALSRRREKGPPLTIRDHGPGIPTGPFHVALTILAYCG
jgi:K+-sensing histidine kinase KdpD